MEDQYLGELLRELPREQARPGFTRRVLSRLDPATAAPGAAPRRPRLAAAVAAAALALTIGGVAVHDRIEAQRAARIARAERTLRELRAEHGQIQRELAALPDEPQVFYVGGTDDMDLVVHLGGAQEAGATRPATYRYDTF
jgi:hypothetical protein